MFYGALDVDTAIAETREPGNIGKIMSMGTFKPVREITILDLARLPNILGVFNEAGRELIQPIRFLHPFADDISRPIAHDGREHIEYVPTQVVTEYVRQAFRDVDSQRWTASPTPARVSPEASRSSYSARTSSASM